MLFPPVPALPSQRDIDSIVHALQAEARTRKSVEREGVAAQPRTVPPTSSLPPLEATHTADFLALPLESFINDAYVRFLGRLPDAGGATYYRRQLVRGRLTRIEVLGRIAYSAEGRRRGVVLPGLAPAFFMASAYRIPIAGPMLALLARALRLPAHWQDRSSIEATAIAAGRAMES